MGPRGHLGAQSGFCVVCAPACSYIVSSQQLVFIMGKMWKKLANASEYANSLPAGKMMEGKSILKCSLLYLLLCISNLLKVYPQRH